jgi:hypothetical protein
MDDVEKAEFDLRLVGDGISIEKKIDRRTARAVLTALMGDGEDPPPSATRASTSREGGRSRPSKSLREFLNEVQATTKPDQIVAIGHFVIEQEGQESFTKDEVKARFAVAKEPMPANFPRDFSAAIRAGMIDEVHGDRGRFYVTRTGQDQIEGRFGRK